MTQAYCNVQLLKYLQAQLKQSD